MTNGGLTDFIKLILTATQGILDFANTLEGKTLIGLTAFAVGIGLVTKAFLFLKPKILEYIAYQSALAVANGVATTSIGALIGGLKALTVAFLTSPFGIATTVVLGITGIVAIVDLLNVSLEENQEKLSELREEYNSTNSIIESTETKLADVRDRIKEIQALGTINTIEQNELDNLILEEARLSSILAIEKERARIKQPELEEQIKKTVETKVTNEYAGTEIVSTPSMTYTRQKQTDRVQVLKDASEEMNRQTDILTELNKQQEINGYLTEEQQNTKFEAIKAYDEASASVSEYAIALENEIVGLDENSETRAYVIEGINAYTEALNQNSLSLEKQTEDIPTTIDELSTLQNSLSTLQTALSGITDETQNFEDFINLISSGGIEEFSLEQYEDLLDTFPQLQNELENYYNEVAKGGDIQEAQNKLVSNFNDELSALKLEALKNDLDNVSTAMSEWGEQSVQVKNALDNIVSENINELLYNIEDGMITLGAEALITSEDIKKVALALYDVEIAGIDSKISEVAKSFHELGMFTQSAYDELYKLAEQKKALQEGKEAINNIVIVTEESTKANEENTDAVEENTKALDAYIETLEKEVEEYEIVIDYVKDKLNEEIEAIEEERDAVLSSIQDKIDALGAEKDAWEDGINDRIALLEAEKDAIDEKTKSELANIDERMVANDEFWESQVTLIESNNDAIKKNIELQKLQEALAKAKSTKVKVLKDGKLDYTSDESAVASAESDIADFEREQETESLISVFKQTQSSINQNLEQQALEIESNAKAAKSSYDQQILDLENYKTAQSNNYDTQLTNLKNHYNNIENEYNANIEKLQEAYTEFEDMLSENAEREAELLYEKLVNEKGSYEERLIALQEFVDEYNAIQSQLSSTLEMGSSSSSASVPSHAQGSYSIQDDEVAFVGDSPNTELVVGAKYNKSMGIPMNLQKGTGILPADKTTTLVKGISDFMSGTNNYSQNTTTRNSSISIGNISFPTVQNTNDMIDLFSDFENKILQKAYS